MTRHLPSLARLTCLALLLVLATGAQGQSEASFEARVIAAESRLAENPPDGEEATTAARQALVRAKQSLERLRAAETFERSAGRTISGLEQTADGDIAAAHAAWLARLRSNAPRRELDTALQAAQAQLAEQRQLLAAARAQLGSGELATTQGERLAELDAQLDALNRLAQPLPVGPMLERLAAETELAALQKEQSIAELRWRAAQAQLGASQSEIARLELQIAALQARLAQADQREAEALLADLRSTTEAAAGTPLEAAALDTLALGERLPEQASRLTRDRESERLAEGAREATARALAAVQSRIGVEASGEALGALLLAERRNLEPPERLAADLDSLRSEAALVRLRLLELPREFAWPERTDSGEEGGDGSAEAALEGTVLRLRSVMQDQRQRVQKRLAEILQRRLDALARTEVSLRRQLEESRSLRQILDAQLLWIPSHAPIDGAWWSRMGASFADLYTPHRWARSLALLKERLDARPVAAFAGLAVCLLLVALRPGFRRRLSAAAPPLRFAPTDHYGLTLKALGLTVLLALPVPLLLGQLGYHWSRAGEPGKFSHSVGLTFQGLAVTVLLFGVLLAVVRERGLAHVHFRWTRARRESLVWGLRLIAPVVIVLQFHVLLAFTRGVDIAIDGAARASAMAFAVVAAFHLWRGLAPGRWWTPRGSSEPFRVRMILRWALCGACLGLLLLLMQGYVFSGAVLLRCLWQSLWLVLAVALAHGLLARWLLLGERRLSHTRLQQQRKQAELAGERSADEAPEIAEEALSVEAVGEQTSRLLRALTLSLLAAGLLWVWSDVYPALERLDSQVVWQYSDVDEQGAAVQGAVTLRSLILGLFALFLTWVAARNLPGLLEIGLLNRIRMDAASRYALSAVSRYLIIVVGAMVGLGLLGMRWSQLQWMAAAFSVGLGFGLQEIFGNFVSGLILLFERPFRVGDVITIGEFTGTVSKIRTRATTLVDFDNKEVVIPNKSFITDRLINWTLSDTRTRIIIRVGVAYGSDIPRVHQLLQQAAAEHPSVLKEPPPASWFLAFGASTLDFELRVFVETMSERLPTTNALNTRIAQLFEEHGVEIAFPQLDLHVRQLPGAAPSAEPGPADR